jgi:hypothetical protein
MPTKPASPVLQAGGLGPNVRAAWLCGEGSGDTLADSGPAGLTATSSGLTWTAGGYGATAAVLANAATAADTGLPTGGAEFTILLGLTTNYSGTYVTVLSRGVAADTQRTNVYLNGGAVAFDGWNNLVQGDTPVADGGPHIVAVTYKASLLSLFVDDPATADATGAFTLNVAGGGGIRLGDEVDTVSRPYTGLLDFALVYDHAMDASERAARFADPFLDLHAAAAAGGRRPPALWLGSFRRPLPRRAARRPGFR